MKKLLVLMLAILVMIPTVKVHGITDVKNYEKSFQLYQLGLFSGESTVSFVPNLEGTTNREQAMVMLSKIFDWNEVGADRCAFLDVSSWAKSAVATAFERGVTSGIGNGQFGGGNVVTERQVISWITRELGYENPYNNIYIARDIGLIDYESAERINKDITNKNEKELIRDDLVGYFYDTLKLVPRGSNETVIEQIIKRKPSLKEKAEKFGFIGKQEELVKIKSIVVPNYFEVAVNFTGTLNKDKALQKDHYIISNNTVNNIRLENNTVILEMASQIKRQGEMVITIKKEVGISEEKQVILSNIIDAEPPTVTMINTISKDLIEITFSEPIYPGNRPIVRINNGANACSVDTPVGRKVKVRLYGAVQPNSTHQISVSGAVDYENLAMTNYSGSFTYKADSEPVSISVKGQVLPNRVTLELNKEIKNVLTTEDIYWSTPINKPDYVTRINETTYEVVFINYPIAPVYEQNLVILPDKLETYWGVKNTGKIVLGVIAYVDDIPPTVEKVEIKNNKDVVIYFSEELDFYSANNIKNYKIVNSEGKEINDNRVAVYNHSAKTVTLQFLNSIQGGWYTITVQNVTDRSLISNEIVPYTFDIKIPDVTPPIVVKAEAIKEEKFIFVTFNEEVNHTAYKTDNWSLSSKHPVVVEKTDDNKVVKLIFSERIISGQTLVMGRIEDSFGNRIASLSTEVQWTEMGDSKLLSAKTVAYNQIELEVDAIISSGLEVQNFMLLDNNNVLRKYVEKVDTKEEKNGKTVLLLTVSDEMNFTASGRPRGIMIEPNSIKTTKGNYLASTVFNTVEDGIRPTVTNTVLNTTINKNTSDLVRIKFDESLTSNNEKYFATDLKVVINGRQLVAGNEFTIEIRAEDVSRDTILIKLVYGFNGGKYVQAGDTVKVYVESPKYLKDASGNLVREFSIEKTVR